MASPMMDADGSGSNGWKFAQCFGDKGDIEEVADGNFVAFIQPFQWV